MTSIRITATQINYYFVCHRKLWLFSHNITMEQNSELVELGKLLHKDSYKRKRKEIEFDGIKIDFFEKNRALIHEVKKSKAIEDAHIWQMKYYIYCLKELGIEVNGKIDYPLLRKTENVRLENNDIEKLQKTLQEIEAILQFSMPPPKLNQKICKKCSYYELCYA